MSGGHVAEQQFAALAEVEHEKVIHDKESKEGLGSQTDIAVLPEGHEILEEGEIWVHPTDAERSGPSALRRTGDPPPWSAYLIGIVEMAERFSYYGCTAVFTNFIQRKLPDGSRTGAGGRDIVAGALGLGPQTANALTTFNGFWVYVVPLFAAYIADTKIGRFRTICWSVAIALLGHILLIICALPGVIEKPHTSLGVFSLAIIIMGVGTGGFKANIAPLVAEQYKVTAMRVKTLKSGERVIVDPAITTQTIYSYFYLLINVGSLVGQIGMTYSERYVGFWLAYTLPTVFFLLSPIVLFLGRNRYARSPPQGSILGDSMRILRTSLKGTFNWNPLTMWRAWKADDFWEKAKPSRVMANGGPDGNGERPAWLHFDDEFVDEVKRGFKACQVFCLFPLWWISYNQINNNLVSQAGVMQTHGVPNDVIQNLDPFALIILIPIFSSFIYPGLERIGFHFTPIKRIFAGFLTGALAMIWSAVVQYYIYKRGPCGHFAYGEHCQPAPLNVWIQTGSYVLIALSEIFASITGLEYAFTKAPKNMRSLVMSIFYFMTAVGNALSEAMNPLTGDPHLIWNYGGAAIIAAVGGFIFWFMFRHLDAQEDDLNEIGAVTDPSIAAKEAAGRQQHQHQHQQPSYGDEGSQNSRVVDEKQ